MSKAGPGPPTPLKNAAAPPITPRMSRFPRLRARLALLGRSESGMALPVALFAMISSMALAGAAVVATIDVQHGASRDNASKAAIAAADAGANVARVRQSRYAYVLNRNTPCLMVGPSGRLERSPAETFGAQEWCPQISGTVGGASFVYRVSAVGVNCGSYEFCVVATGTANGVNRRIEVAYNRSGTNTNLSEENLSIEELAEKELKERERIEREAREIEEEEGAQKAKEHEEEELKKLEEEAKAFAAEGFVGREGIVLSGNADIRVGVGTNGSLVTSGNASICGDVRHGVGRTWTKSGNASQCSGYQVTEGNRELPPVSSFIPLDIATNNSNARITACTATNVPANCQKDSYTGDWGKKPPFNPGSRTITLSSNETLTVGGGDYWICAISMSGNSQLIMADGARVRFFFDTPENCGYNGNQISLSGNNRIAATGYQPSDGQFEMPGFYLLGSPTIATQINLSGNYSTTNEMIVYAPDTYINISGNATFKGMIAGRKIEMSGNGKVEQDDGFVLPPELNPGAHEEGGETIEEPGEEEPGSGGGSEEGESSEGGSEEEETVVETENGVSTETNTSANYFTPQAYFECSGLAPAGLAPNANC